MSFVTWWYPVVAWGVALAALSGTAARVVPGRVPGWVPAAVGLLAFVPFAGLPLGRWLHGLGMSFSVPLVVVFVDFALRSVGAAAPLDSAAQRAAAWFGVIAGLLLYPGALGLGSFDPYVLGWRWPGVAAGACAAAAGLAIAGNRFAIVLVGTAVAWHAGMLESDNAWDYLVDPVYAVLSAVNLVGGGLVAVLRRGPVPLAMCVILGVAPMAGGAEPPVSRAMLDEAWAAAAADLERRADRTGHREFAALARDWTVHPEPGRQQVFRVPARLDVPTWIDTADEEAMWRDFVAARKARAAGLFRLAVEAAQAHADVPTRAERAAGRPPPLPQRGCEALELLYAALRDDPEHERAREAGGWVRRDGTWIWPEVARRLDAGEIHDVARGWGPRSRSGRDPPRRMDAPVTWNSDHWKITSPAGVDAAAALAAELELAHDVWRQAFGAFALEPADLERAFEGRGRPVPHGPFAATLFADRAAYVGALEKLEPTIARTLGVYWTPTRTAYFFPARGTAGDDGEPNAATIHHEATHQLFAEMRKTSPLAGERSGFWALEAAACYVESLRPTAYGWTLGGRDAGRGPAARERLVEDGFHVPLAELCALGRAQLQADERLPAIYSQISGLADFFMNGERGRHREAFVEYLVRVFTGSVSADTLARLCGMSYEELDDAYRRHMAR